MSDHIVPIVLIMVICNFNMCTGSNKDNHSLFKSYFGCCLALPINSKQQ